MKPLLCTALLTEILVMSDKNNSVVSGNRLTGRKRILSIVLLILSLMSASCEKIKDVPLGTITVSVDGRKRSFNTNAKAEHLTVENGYGVWIHGFRGDAGSSNEMSITIASPDPITARTYTQSPYGSLVEIKYSVYLIFFIDEYISSTATVKISEINSTHVKGTFSGTLIYSTGGTSTKELTGGAFNVSF